MESIDFIGLGVMSFGGLIFLIGWIWLIILAFKQGGVMWGLLMILFNWLTGLIFCLVKKTGWLAFILMTIGGIASGIGAGPVISKLIKTITG